MSDMGAWFCLECDKNVARCTPTCEHCGAAANYRRRGAEPEEIADIIAAAMGQRTQSDAQPEAPYCGDCDGCGWVEGGATLKTTCKTCNGTGREPATQPEAPSVPMEPLDK